MEKGLGMNDFKPVLLIFVFIILDIRLFATNIEIKKHNATIICTEIISKDKNITYERYLDIGTYTLNKNIIKVCKKNGEIWLNKRKLDKCKVIKINKNNWLALIKNLIFYEPQIVNASSVRDITIQQDISIKNTMDYLIIKKDNFTPTKISIYNKSDIEIGNIKKENINIPFYIPKTFLKNGYKIKIYNKDFIDKPKYIFHIKQVNN